MEKPDNRRGRFGSTVPLRWRLAANAALGVLIALVVILVGRGSLS